MFCLLTAEGDPDRGHPVLDGGTDNECTPPAPHVEQSLARCQLELPADQIQLAALRLFEGVRRGQERSRRVHQLWIEKLGEELVPCVVVEGNGLPVPADGVTEAGHSRPVHPWTPSLVGQLAEQAEQPDRSGGIPRRIEHRHSELEQREHVALDVDIVVYVGFACGQIGRRQQHRSQRTWVLQHESGASVGRTPGVAGPGPDARRRDDTAGDKVVIDLTRDLRGVHRVSHFSKPTGSR